jgi:hypothetical protein
MQIVLKFRTNAQAMKEGSVIAGYLWLYAARMSKPFYGARLKIERAKHHIHDLYLRVEEFVAEHPYIIRRARLGGWMRFA